MAAEPDEQIVKELRRTRDLIGEIYPVIRDKKGRVVDGKHRLRAGWKGDKTINQLDSDAKSVLARIIAHRVRRKVGESEQKTQVNVLAGLVKNRGIKPGKIGPLLSEMTGVPLSQIDRWLGPEFKIGHFPEKMETPPTPPPAEEPSEAKKAAKEAGKLGAKYGEKGAEFGKLGGRPPRYLRVCPSCGFKGKASAFGKIPAAKPSEQHAKPQGT